MYLIFYDITETSIRTKVSKLLEREGFERIQFSVFLAHFNPEKNDLWLRLTKLLVGRPSSKIFCLKISKESFYAMKVIGKFNQDFDYLAGEKRSLIL